MESEELLRKAWRSIPPRTHRHALSWTNLQSGNSSLEKLKHYMLESSCDRFGKGALNIYSASILQQLFVVLPDFAQVSKLLALSESLTATTRPTTDLLFTVSIISVTYCRICLDYTNSASKCPSIAHVDAFMHRRNAGLAKAVWATEETLIIQISRNRKETGKVVAVGRYHRRRLSASKTPLQPLTSLKRENTPTSICMSRHCGVPQSLSRRQTGGIIKENNSRKYFSGNLYKPSPESVVPLLISFQNRVSFDCPKEVSIDRRFYLPECNDCWKQTFVTSQTQSSQSIPSCLWTSKI